MADHTIGRLTYIPGKTLGRSGYVDSPAGRLAERVRHLDALLCVITCSDGPDGDDGFLGLNLEIQRATLDLASSLATEIHELHEEVAFLNMKDPDQALAQPQPPQPQH